jgi:glycosyltransferase involved in cell wall biosynthesis
MANFSSKISIAIVTRNRPNSLRRTLNSLQEQSYKPYEIVVSDDSTDQTKQILSEEVSLEYGARYIKGPSRGLYANRNFAALACSGTHIRTMDDDHEFPADHFKIVREWVEKYPNDVLVIGEVSPDGSSLEKPYPIPGQLHPRGFSAVPKDLDQYFGISCGGSIYPKKIFDLGYRCSEEFLFGYSYLEFGCLLKAKGQKIRPISNTFLIHHYESSELRLDDIVVPSILFSIICQSWYYQPSNKNKILSTIQMAFLLFKRRKKFIHDLVVAQSAATQRWALVSSLPDLKNNFG